MVRDIRKLDVDIKQEYGLVIASLFKNLMDADVFQMRAFYKILAYIQVPKKHRKKILNFLISDEPDEESLQNRIEYMLNKLKGQERDILRFTLMEDLLVMATANSYMSEEKKALLEKVQEYLLITDEQMKIFEKELEPNGGLSLRENNSDKKNLFKNKLSKGMAIGVPLFFLYYSPHNAYRHNFSSFALLQLDKKLNPQKSLYTLGNYLILGSVLYSLVVWGLNQRDRRNNKLKKILLEETQQLINRSKKYLEEDLSYFEKSLKKSPVNEVQNNYKILMEKTLKIINE